MHQPLDDTPTVVRVTDATTRAELEEAMGNIRATLRRMPAHWTERRAGLHAKINALLDDWERAPDGRPPASDA